MYNDESNNVTNLDVCWYLPVINKEQSEVKGDGNSIEFKFKHEKIDGYDVIGIDIMNEEGKVDEYLADLISELWYVASFSRLYIDKEGCIDNETLEELKVVNEIHEDIIFLKKAYYREIEKLRQYELDINNNYDFDYIYRYWGIFRKEKRRIDYLIDNFIGHREDARIKIPFYRLKNDLIHKKTERFAEETERLVEETKRRAIEYLKKLRIFWTNLYNYALPSDYKLLIEDKNLSDTDLIDRMKVLEKNMGRIQTKCCLCLVKNDAIGYLEIKRDRDWQRFSNFKELISHDPQIRREYTGTKAKRCYSQMWIDNFDRQYFALSGAPENDNVGNYYIIAENILNRCRGRYDHCIFKQAPFTEEMRYYYTDTQVDYVEYQDVKGEIETRELSLGFSCCERKLLIKVEELRENNDLDNKNVHIFVKYSPCIICERALNAYEKHGSNFKIIELEKYAGKKSKYLDLDNKIKGLEF